MKNSKRNKESEVLVEIDKIPWMKIRIKYMISFVRAIESVKDNWGIRYGTQE